MTFWNRWLMVLALAALGVDAVANLPPVAQDDRAAVRDDGGRIDVLANDSDPDGDALTLAAVGRAAKGTASVQTFRGKRYAFYKPAAGFTGEDSFRYTVRDPSGATAQATVTIYNTAPHADPVALYPHFQRVSAYLPVGDPDGLGQALHVTVGQARHGKAEVYQREYTTVQDGLVEHYFYSEVFYTPGADFAGTDSFTYTVKIAGVAKRRRPRRSRTRCLGWRAIFSARCGPPIMGRLSRMHAWKGCFGSI